VWFGLHECAIRFCFQVMARHMNESGIRIWIVLLAPGLRLDFEISFLKVNV
jgi:hypothetical protein